ncbi:MAG: galactose-1-phosphate uridylyltransferase [Candidatus Omnitrophica bacterium]|nr:galactose-1-phosphate uridylyltransferase [Candidatus Omnitrophota bacterium]
MPQLRKDPITGRWVIVNVEEPMRADAFKARPHQRSSKTCSFCPGNESMTPPEILVYKKPAVKGAAPWQIRVVPNKFPALRIEESTDKYAFGIYDKLGGFGAHEVIVETPDHDKQIADLPLEQVELVLKAYRERCLDLRKDPRFKYILIFKNYGQAAGASLEHPHSQLIALPIVPSRVQGEIKGSVSHYEYAERCIYCDMVNQERAERKLTVFEEGDFLGFCPFASRFPFETWVLPKSHEAHFDAISDDDLKGLAKALKAVFLKMKLALKDPAYNFMIHTIPIYAKEAEAYHWHIEIIPHLTRVAGFELGTGFYLNPTPPELAAETLRGQPAGML